MTSYYLDYLSGIVAPSVFSRNDHSLNLVWIHLIGWLKLSTL